LNIITDITQAHLTKPSVLTIGTFDGLHRGHTALMQQLKEAAARQQAASAVIAFHPRPKTVLAPHLPNNDYLTTPAERIALFEACGIDVLILIPFTLEFAQTTAVDFMQRLVDHLHLVQFWCGHDFALGKNREGTMERLAVLGQQMGYTVHEFLPVLIDGQIISSTQIRRFVEAGHIRQAAQFLGRYPAVTGAVVQGDQRGRALGFPTANLLTPPERLLPANGVYATFARLTDGARRPAVTNVGLRPSFQGSQRTVETYIFDFNRDIYGQSVTLEFVEYLRPEKKFNGLAELKAQISQDSAQAGALLAAEIKNFVIT
jgi:riboflavin kinase/FMN adenylyltransferase